MSKNSQRKIHLTLRLDYGGPRHKYLKELKKHLQRNTLKIVTYQEVFEVMLDILMEDSNLPCDEKR